MKIIVDAMGGDHAPLQIVLGAGRRHKAGQEPFKSFLSAMKAQ